MSVPDALVSIRAGLNCYARYSEYEPESCLWKLVRGIWYDNFDGGSLEADLVEKTMIRMFETEMIAPHKELTWKSNIWIPFTLRDDIIN